MNSFKFLLPFFLLLTSSRAFSDEIYRWTDREGQIHYSTKAPDKNAKPVVLPKLVKGEVKLPKVQLYSCDGHGGANCAAGADADGSVVCYDGFKNAAARFRLTCSSPRLEVVQLSPEEAGAFRVTIRNKKPVDAHNVVVKLKSDVDRPTQLAGPDEIEALGTGDYVFTPKSPLMNFEKPTVGNIEVVCSNC